MNIFFNYQNPMLLFIYKLRSEYYTMSLDNKHIESRSLKLLNKQLFIPLNMILFI